jgi:Phage MuF-C-terminal domain
MGSINFQTSVQLILQASAAGAPHHEHVLSLGPTPQYLLDYGFPPHELQVKAAVIDKAHFDHGIPKKLLERLGDVIASPTALYKSATVTDSAVVVTLEQRNGSPILIPMRPNQQIGRQFVNAVSSVYNKDKWGEVEAYWRASGLLVWKK